MKAYDVSLTFHGWPAGEQWRAELEALKELYDVNPLRAYDIDGKLILPRNYERQLIGAVVRLQFTFIHYAIGNWGSTLVIHARELNILRNAQALPKSPFKRRNLMAGPSTPSLSRQSRDVE